MSAAGTELKPADAVVSAPFFLRGELVEGQDAVHRSRDLGVTFAQGYLYGRPGAFPGRPDLAGATAVTLSSALWNRVRPSTRLPLVGNVLITAFAGLAPIRTSSPTRYARPSVSPAALPFGRATLRDGASSITRARSLPIETSAS